MPVDRFAHIFVLLMALKLVGAAEPASICDVQCHERTISAMAYVITLSLVAILSAEACRARESVALF
jgi:hypothetical protein